MVFYNYVLHTSFFVFFSCLTEKILKFSYPNNIKSKLYTVCNSLHTCQARTTFMLLSTTFNNISVITYNGGQFYWWRTPRKPCPDSSTLLCSLHFQCGSGADLTCYLSISPNGAPCNSLLPISMFLSSFSNKLIKWS
jgi:hypothetical protein